MKLTPLDIHHKEFRNSLRGYSVDEVDKFLDEVADEFERLFKENIDLSERLEAARDQVRNFEAQKETLHNTMVAAQRTAEDIAARARDEAATMLKDAEVKAKEIIHDALTQKQKAASDLVRIKQAEEEFRSSFTRLLEAHLKSVTPVPLPEDVTVLLGQTGSGVVGDVRVEETKDTRPKQTTVPALAKAEQQPESRVNVEPIQKSPAKATEAEPPSSGFVQSIALGELARQELADEEPVFEDPKEFSHGSLSRFGERDEDPDIEEID